MTTQKQRLDEATSAYIFPLNKSDYQVYLCSNGGLDNLWPSDSNLGQKSAELLPFQVYQATKDNLPAFLFRLRNTARRTACRRIAAGLRDNRYQCDGLPVYVLDGGSPDLVLGD